jgi:small subunit ribosomal protein S7
MEPTEDEHPAAQKEAEPEKSGRKSKEHRTKVPGEKSETEHAPVKTRERASRAQAQAQKTEEVGGADPKTEPQKPKSNIKVFGRWDPSEVVVRDPGMAKHISSLGAVVHSGGKHAKQRNKAEISIVERLMNKMMRRKYDTGKKQKTYNIVKDAFEIIHKNTKKNPLQVLVDAVENAGPREETVRLRYGGIVVSKAVDPSTRRRIDHALRLIAQGVKAASFSSKRTVEECLASELIAAAKYDVKAFSIRKKEEKERVAKATR